MLSPFLEQQQLPDSYQATANQWFASLVTKINTLAKTKAPWFIGINGSQGSGKSTLAAYLEFTLTQQYKLRVANLSLDDFYLSREERESLAKSTHPLFRTRGVPGTHNTELLCNTLKCLQEGASTTLPRFDKATDNPKPTSDWPTIDNEVDIVIIEGWCWGVKPQSEASLTMPINKLEQEHDKTLEWRKYINHALNSEYLPLYDMVDTWLMLKAPSFEQVADWRWQQEQKLIEKVGQVNNKTMTKAQVNTFIAYFQRLTEHALATLPQDMDITFELAIDRSITKQVGSL
ncbi:kinase [Thalassotalea euphylliae]|uniref:kinase n=1 Tax=Thalassotalea euphylliae TaxID=1655234 RepID=UPI00362AB98C